MKRGPLSNQEKEYITDQLANLSVEDLAVELNRSESIVQKFVDSVEVAPTSVVEEVRQQRRNTDKLFARNQNYGVTIMTQAASEQSDQNRSKPKPPARYRDVIHKIKGD